MRHIITLVVSTIFTVSGLFGQSDRDVLFNAMKDEMDRSMKELTLPNSPTPFFMSYTVGDIRYINLTSTLGTTLYYKESPGERIHSVNLYVGDKRFSSDYSYTGNGVSSTSLSVIANNYNQLRRNFWQTSDIAYKMAVEVFNSKQNNIRTANISPQEKDLDDMLPVDIPVVNTGFTSSFKFDRALYEGVANELSSLFKKYPAIFESRVEINGIETTYSLLSTEGTKTVEPAGYLSLTFKGKVRTTKGQILRDQETIYARNNEELPSKQQLSAMLEKFASHLTALASSSEVEEYYLGPVLFENEASATILANNLISPSGIFAYRKPIQVMATVGRPENIGPRRDLKALEERINKKVIDSRISVVNRTDLQTFDNQPLFGYYNIDAQGIVPENTVQVIDNGILKRLLSTRVPTKSSNRSTGSLRYGARPRSITHDVAPGNLLITAKDGLKREDLKRELIKAAVEEGLDYAYIVRKIADDTDQYIVRVCVKDGSETLVTGAEVSSVPLAKLKRVLGLSEKHKIYNYLYQNSIPVSIVYPAGILIEDIEINRKPVNVLKDSPLIGR